MLKEAKIRYRCDIAMAVLVVLIMAVICIMSTNDIFASLYYIDDMVSYISGTNFAEQGFIKLHFLPVHSLGPAGDIPRYYLHYPPLPNVMNGLMQALGIRDLTAMRIICGVFLAAGLVFMYKALSGVVGPFASLCGTVFICTTQYFFRLALSIHHHSYDILFLGIFLLIFLRTVENEKSHKIRWFFCWISLVLGALSSYEFIIYSQIFICVYLIAAGSVCKRWTILIFLLTAPVVGIGLHFVQNCWAIGFSAALRDNLGFNFWKSGLTIRRWKYTWQVPETIVGRSLYYYNISVLSLIILAVLVPVLEKQKYFPLKRTFYAVFSGVMIASTGWFLFMPGHTIMHPHTINQLLPAVIIIMGCIFAVMLKILFNKDSERWHKILIAATLFVLLAAQAQSLVKNHLRGYHRTPENTILQAIGPEGLKKDAAFLCNLWWLGAPINAEYLLQRQCWTVKEEYNITPICPDPNKSRFLQNFQWDVCPPEYLLYCIDNNYTLKQLYEYLTGVSCDGCPLRYFIYFGRENYKNSQLYKILADNFPGRKKKIESDVFGEEKRIFIFDISSLQLDLNERPVLDPEIKHQQLQGDYPQWQIPGFDERLKKYVEKYRLAKESKERPKLPLYGVENP